MAFALDVVVAVGAFKRLRTDPQNAVVEHIEDVEAGEVAAGVAGAARLDEPQQCFAVLHRFELKLAFSQHENFLRAWKAEKLQGNSV